MKKEVPPFGVLAADYNPDTHIIVRNKSERKPEVRKIKPEEDSANKRNSSEE